ncbi:hypothetical protein B0T16DRAFT_402338 [Cercophora newfieldiana]|uniref:PAS domain-containing protein n=1 Tax=Cercophora newfieldiana TaxID=92897 RepID=A0AA40CZT8_9PEZI|nr:hypothetical protein B0T16DRAFT_402338 [Cercophora newfieldiana]
MPQQYGSAGIAHGSSALAAAAAAAAAAAPAEHPQQQQQHVFSPEDMAPNVPGAGPMPVAGLSSASSNPAVTSTLTEFTKRRNWPARVVEELGDLLHILDANGKIKHVSLSVEKLLGYTTTDILNKFLQDYLHPDDVGVFNSEFNDAIASGAPLRMFYRLKKKDGSFAVFEVIGHAHIAAAKFAPNPNNQTPFCQAVFMMARPYPIKQAALLHSFLEHKMENERLKRRIAELRKEEAEEVEESQRTWRLSQEGRSDLTPSEGTARAGNATPFYQHGANPATSPDLAMPPPERPPQAPANVALTRENLEGVAGGRPDSIRDKMARFERVTHEETLELLTGIPSYRDGDRARGITAGNGSPTVIKGDAGIAIPMDRDPRTGEKKKKAKVAEEYVCTDCGRFPRPSSRL